MAIHTYTPSSSGKISAIRNVATPFLYFKSTASEDFKGYETSEYVDEKNPKQASEIANADTYFIIFSPRYLRLRVTFYRATNFKIFAIFYGLVG